MNEEVRRLARVLGLMIILGLCSLAPGQSGRTPPPDRVAGIPLPEGTFGFKIGEERRLARWEQFINYFRQLDAASDRLQLDELGKTTLGRPFITATISAPGNLRQLDKFKNLQRQLADPRLLAGADSAMRLSELIRQGKTIVVITCSIHSTEVGGSFTATELAYRLASDNSPETRQILEETILLLIPSLNPDGTDIVADWYRRTLGTPAEGTTPPELYHHYTGHDNNRDWYAFTQLETQMTVDRILNVWHPQILHDIHQMGSTGARYFVPPYIDPWEPNIDPAIIAGVSALGSSIAWELTAQGKSGVVTNGIFDAWTPARAFAHYHAGLRILSETASARLATPIEIQASRLTSGLGYDARTASWNFPRPWMGGRWTLRDIIDYQTSGALALLNHAARYREQYLRNFFEIGRRAVAPKTAPYAFLLLEPPIPGSLKEAARRVREGLAASTGTQEEKHQAADQITRQVSSESSTAEEVNYYLKIEGLDRLLGVLQRGGVEIKRAQNEFSADGRRYPAGTHIVLLAQPYGAFAKALLERQRYPDLRDSPNGPLKRPYDVTAHTLPLLMSVNAVAVRDPFQVELKNEPYSVVIQSRVRSQTQVRVGLYRSFAASMDEGWTRWVFDQYKFPFTSLVDREVRAGGLNAKYDAIILPDQSDSSLFGGLSSAAGYPEEFTGGIGEAGVRALREFVAAGGTLIALNEASNFAIERLGLPVRNVLRGVSPKDFYCPGSILRTRLDESSPLAFGLDPDSIAWFEESPAFEVTNEAAARVIARYPADVNPLISGWISGDGLIRGKAALVEARLGDGRVVLFGFRPQYRGQSLATIPLLFNAILTSKPDK